MKWDRPITVVTNYHSPWAALRDIMSGLNCFIDIYSAFTLGELHKQEIRRTKAGRAAVAGGKRRVISAVRIQKISRVLVMREKTRGKKGTDTHLVFQAQKGSCSQGC